MTAPINAFLVVLDRDIREDDAAVTLSAIAQIKGVLEVTPHTRSFEDHIAYIRVKTKVLSNLAELFNEE